MNEPLQIKWKLFIPWLKSKPAEHQYVYGDCGNCIICQFVKETHGEEIRAGGTYVRKVGQFHETPIPYEITSLVALESTIGGVLLALQEQPLASSIRRLSRLEPKGEV